eukprot:TRINITY_DN2769_c0_g1_i1.p1 TRINITY_DN2769_c0_g1~~TRINITY_DN2769_c0_g1_i1.p1  ORF type:complete len:101 (-),score=18.95 TRINITY_DN2769_c0_g1_i1:412-714(-)
MVVWTGTGMVLLLASPGSCNEQIICHQKEVMAAYDDGVCIEYPIVKTALHTGCQDVKYPAGTCEAGGFRHRCRSKYFSYWLTDNDCKKCDNLEDDAGLCA